MTGANTYTGTTTISQGILQLGTGVWGEDGSLATNGIINNASLVYNVSGYPSIVYPISGTGSLTKQGAGNLMLNAANTFSGATNIDQGKIVLGNALARQNSVYNTVVSTETFGLDLNGQTTLALGGLSGSVDLASAVTGYGNVTAVTLSPQTGVTASYSGVITDGVTGTTLTKSGAGTQVLSGINTFTGNTFINDGTLSVASIGNQGATTSNIGAGTTIAFGAGTTTGTLRYTGGGETTDRIIDLSGTTGRASGRWRGLRSPPLFGAGFGGRILGRPSPFSGASVPAAMMVGPV